MYSSSYGYGNAAGPPYNGAPQGSNPQMPPGSGPNQPQQQSMMYNQQQYPMGHGGGGGFSGAPNPGAMMPGAAGPAGMMQNTALPHMSANSQMGYQAPYTSSPYGPNVPSTAAAPQGQYNPNYMMNNTAGGYQMNPAGMNPQQQQHQMMLHRMQQAQQNQSGMGTPNQQRHYPGPQGTPNSVQHSQFGTPQNSASTPQANQTPTPAPHSANSVTTPQTPTFPLLGQGPTANGNSAPASPGTQEQERERVALLLGINTELLYEIMFLQHTVAELRDAIKTASPDQATDLKKEEQSVLVDHTQVHRRLQANLSYLAGLTNQKTDGPRQAAPMYLSSPPLNMELKLRPLPANGDTAEVDGMIDRADRAKEIKEMYTRLHLLFPGVDPTKEPTSTPVSRVGGPSPGMEALNAQRMSSIGAQMQGSSAPSPASSAHQTTPQMAQLPGLPSASAA